MRSYIFQFSQPKAIRLNLTIQELLILDHLLQFFSSGNASNIKDAKTNKIFYWVTYKKIADDLQILRIGKERVRQIINNLCNLQVLEKYESLHKSTKVYYNINYNALIESADDTLIHQIGQDVSLKYYISTEKTEGFYNFIKYNNMKYIYISSAVDDKLIKKFGLENFTDLLQNNLSKLVSSTVFHMGLKQCNVSILRGEIIVYHDLPEAVVQMNVYRIERAIVDAYISVINSETADIMLEKSC